MNQSQQLSCTWMINFPEDFSPRSSSITDTEKHYRFLISSTTEFRRLSSLVLTQLSEQGWSRLEEPNVSRQQTSIQRTFLCETSGTRLSMSLAPIGRSRIHKLILKLESNKEPKQ